MAIPITPWNGPSFRDVLAAQNNSLDFRLAMEKRAIDERRYQQEMAMKEREMKRQAEQNMRRANLDREKFEFEKSMGMPGGLDYLRTMANVRQSEAAMARSRQEMQQNEPGGLDYEYRQAQIASTLSAADQNRAQAALYQERAENPQAFMRPATPSSAGAGLSAAQKKANVEAWARGFDPPFPTGSAVPSAQAAPGDWDSPPLPDGSGGVDDPLLPGDMLLPGSPPPVAPDPAIAAGLAAVSGPGPVTAPPATDYQAFKKRELDIEDARKRDGVIAQYEDRLQKRAMAVEQLREYEASPEKLAEAERLESEARTALDNIRRQYGIAPATEEKVVTPASAPDNSPLPTGAVRRVSPGGSTDSLKGAAKYFR